MTTAAAADDDLSRAKRTWDTIDIDKVREVAWSAIPFFQEKLWRRFCGSDSPQRFVLKLLQQRLAEHGRTAKHGIALVCGDMTGERSFLEDPMLPFESADGYDLSDASLARFRPKDSLRFVGHLEDVNNLRLAPESADLIVGWHGLHHVYNLGNLFYQANRALRPGGLLVMYEWIGPRYLQIPRMNRWVSGLLLHTLFPSRSTRTTHMGKVKGWSWIQDEAAAFDPSEACNSEELYAQFERYFVPLRAHRHAALTYPMFEGIRQNLDCSSTLNRMRFNLVHAVEMVLSNAGLIQPLFVVAVGARRELDDRAAPSAR